MVKVCEMIGGRRERGRRRNCAGEKKQRAARACVGAHTRRWIERPSSRAHDRAPRPGSEKKYETDRPPPPTLSAAALAHTRTHVRAIAKFLFFSPPLHITRELEGGGGGWVGRRHAFGAERGGGAPVRPLASIFRVFLRATARSSRSFSFSRARSLASPG